MIKTIKYSLDLKEVTIEDQFEGENNVTNLVFDFTGCEVDTWAKWVDVKLANGVQTTIALGTDIECEVTLDESFMIRGRMEIQPFAIGLLGEKIAWDVKGIYVQRSLATADVDQYYDPSTLDYIQLIVSQDAIKVAEIWAAYESGGLLGEQGPQGVQGIQGIQGEQGIQGIKGDTGLTGATGPKGDTGIQGEQGPQGVQGVQGITGIQGIQGIQGELGPEGPQGPQGLDGADAVAGKLPSTYVELESPQRVTSATFIDVPGMSGTITLDEPVEIAVFASFELQTQSGASASVIELCFNIDGVDHDPVKRYLSGSNDLGIGALVHRSGEFTEGTYTVKLRYRRVSGVSTPGINKADMLIMAMQGARGVQGLQGIQGIQGLQGIQGNDGPQGLQGIQGEIGPQGIQGIQGIQGEQGVTPDISGKMEVDGSNSDVTTLTFSNGTTLVIDPDRQVANFAFPDGTTANVPSELWYAEGKATEVIAEGDNVMFAGSQGDHYLVKKAVASELATNPHLYAGIATKASAINAWVKITKWGLVNNIDTNGWVYGTRLYFNPSTLGLTDTLPALPNARIYVGMVVKQGTTTGILLVDPEDKSLYTNAELDTLFSSHTHKSIVNEVSVDNAKVEALSTGVKVTRNINDANTALIVNNQLGTGNLIEMRLGNVNKAFFTNAGILKSDGILNVASFNNSSLDMLTTGAKISRNIADANPALIVNQANASSTGKIQSWQFGNVEKAYVDKDGYMYTNRVRNTTSLNNSQIQLLDTGVGVYRNVADANTCLLVSQANASSNGYMIDAQFVGVTKFRVDIYGNIDSQGYIKTVSVQNSATPDNSKVDMLSTGIVISRNVADANHALIVDLKHASSTGKILDLRAVGTSKFSVDNTGLITKQSWIAPTLLNSWANASGYVCQYRKNALGNVDIIGRVTGGALSTVIFTLPAGYCPPQRQFFVINGNGGNTWGYVDSNGDVYLTGGQITNVNVNLIVFV